MASLDQPLPAGTTRAPTRRWSEYTQLSRQVKQAGLLERRHGWYAAKIALNLVLLAAGGVAFVLLGDSWWQLAIAALLAVVFTQIGFIGHDAGHRQIFRPDGPTTWSACCTATWPIGLSYGWWVDKHNRHHAHPNHEDKDPDIDIGALAFTAGRPAPSGACARFIARHQGYLFFPLLLLEAVHLHVASVQASLASRGPGQRWSRRLLLWPHAAGYLTRRAAGALAGQGGRVHPRPAGPVRPLPGLLVRPQPQGHADARPQADQIDFLRRQVLTSRNVRGSWWSTSSSAA